MCIERAKKLVGTNLQMFEVKDIFFCDKLHEKIEMACIGEDRREQNWQPWAGRRQTSWISSPVAYRPEELFSSLSSAESQINRGQKISDKTKAWHKYCIYHLAASSIIMHWESRGKYKTQIEGLAFHQDNIQNDFWRNLVCASYGNKPAKPLTIWNCANATFSSELTFCPIYFWKDIQSSIELIF